MKGGKEREHIRGGPDIDEGTLPKHPRAGGKGRASEDERRPREGGQQRDRDWMLSMSAVRLPTRDWYTDVASVLGACCWRRHMLLPMGSAICRGGICVSSTCAGTKSRVSLRVRLRSRNVCFFSVRANISRGVAMDGAALGYLGRTPVPWLPSAACVSGSPAPSRHPAIAWSQITPAVPCPDDETGTGGRSPNLGRRGPGYRRRPPDPDPRSPRWQRSARSLPPRPRTPLPLLLLPAAATRTHTLSPPSFLPSRGDGPPHPHPLPPAPPCGRASAAPAHSR